MKLLLTFAMVATASAQESGPVSVSRPNVLLILADDLGYSDLGCYGGEIPTPHIDQLAGDGLRFTQCYNSARCCPSRASLLTGLHPHQAGIGSFTYERPDEKRGPAYLGRLNDRCVTLAEVLKTAGYGTYMVGKWHVGAPGPIERGFDEFYGFTRGYEQDQWQPQRYQRLPQGRVPELEFDKGEFYATAAFSDYALEFLKQARSKDQPWFLYLAHLAPHFPVQAPAATVDELVATYRRGWDALRADRFERMKASGLATDAFALTDRSMVPVDRDDIANGYSGRPNPAWDELPEDRREDLARRMAVFAAMVRHVDEGVGRLVASLREHDELENTLILFLSDNGACYEWGPFGFDGPSRRGNTVLHQGEQLSVMGGPGTYHSYGSAWANLGNTPFRLYKHFTHEGGICTPLIAHWPAGISRPDTWVRDPVHVMDLMPTLCEVGGAEYPEDVGGRAIQPMEGESLVAAFRGEALPERALAFEHQDARAIRRGRWKAVRGKRMPGETDWKLYDLETDRCETRDLAATHPERTRDLAEEWLQWARRVKVYPFFENAEKEARRAVVTPQIANRPLHVQCKVTPGSGDGVLLAQGGRTHGYALHLESGILWFSVRIGGDVTALRGPVAPNRPYQVSAHLRGDGRMELAVDGGDPVTGRAPGLIPVQPIDELSIGRDTQTAVGKYRSPHSFDGVVDEVTVMPGERSPAKPNIILVFIDDMGWADLSCFGNRAVQTENIDGLAREGIRFEQFYVNSPICSPSRVAISTGQYPQRWCITSYLANRQSNIDRGMAQWLDPQAPMLARRLQQAGYATGHFGKWHMGGQRDVGDAPLITEYGFDASLTNFEGLGPRVLPMKDAYDGEPPRPHALGSDRLGRGKVTWEDRSRVTASFTSAAIEFIDAAVESERPFYVNLWPDDVHSPFFPPEERRGDGSKRTRYHGVLETMDEQLGVLFDRIRNSKALRDNTLILLCSDNGPEPGAGSSQPLRGHKTMLYEGGIRSSLVVWGPGLIEGSSAGASNTKSVFAAIDLVPSLLAIAGVEPPAPVEFDGEPLPEVLRGASDASRRTPLFFRRPPDRDRFYGVDDLPDLAVIHDGWKLLCEYDGSEVELYDLGTDPGETRNVANGRPEVVKRLMRTLLAWHQAMPPDLGATYRAR